MTSLLYLYSLFWQASHCTQPLHAAQAAQIPGARRVALLLLRSGPAYEVTDRLEQLITTRHPPRLRLAERKRPADGIHDSIQATEAARVANVPIHHLRSRGVSGRQYSCKTSVQVRAGESGTV